ncbi:MAG: Fic family protein [Cytophagales bacterium]|nr:Fic family protein [Cytophagales bacterium]
MLYNWQHKEWPDFTFNLTSIQDELFEFTHRMGQVYGLANSLGKQSKDDSLVDILITEAIKTSEIEGEFFSREDVMSSIKKNLGFTVNPKQIVDLRVIGISDLLISVRNDYSQSLSQKMLFDWHKLLMKGSNRIKVGKWRTGPDPMQVVSGAIGREVVHFEALPSNQLPKEMKTFIQWFNASAPKSSDIKNAPIRAAIAHLYFESIHPFEDGNGRIGRALADKALSQGTGKASLISLSHTLNANKKEYYQALKQAQQTLDLTEWLHYFINVLLEAEQESIYNTEHILQKAKFFDRFGTALNSRQKRVISKMFDAGYTGFEGGMSAKKYMTIAKTTKPTATRDLQQLVSHGALIPTGGGRSTHYDLNLDN